MSLSNEDTVHSVRQSRSKTGMPQRMEGRVWDEEGEMRKAEAQTGMQKNGKGDRAKGGGGQFEMCFEILSALVQHL